MEDDIFDSLLNLEDEFYDEGYQLGVADGSRAGHIEGRVFGLEKGFEKYVTMGKLQGRSVVWSGRLPRARQQREAIVRENADPSDSDKNKQTLQEEEDQKSSSIDATSAIRLPTLPDNPRLEKHVRTLYALVEAASLSTRNTEEAVSDFDDRQKRATAKAKIIERLVGEAGYDDASNDGGQSEDHNRRKTHDDPEGGDGSIEDISSLHARH